MTWGDTELKERTLYPLVHHRYRTAKTLRVTIHGFSIVKTTHTNYDRVSLETRGQRLPGSLPEQGPFWTGPQSLRAHDCVRGGRDRGKHDRVQEVRVLIFPLFTTDKVQSLVSLYVNKETL